MDVTKTAFPGHTLKDHLGWEKILAPKPGEPQTANQCVDNTELDSLVEADSV